MILRRLPLAVVLAAALFAFARSLSSTVGFVLGVAACSGPLLAVRIDPSLERLARLLARLAVVAAVLVGWALMVAPMLHGERADDVMRTIGFVLAGCALPLAIRDPREHVSVLLASAGLLLVAGLHRRVEIRPHVAVAAIATALHVVVRTREEAKGRLLGNGRLVAAAVAIMLGVAAPIVFWLPPLHRSVTRALTSRTSFELRGRSGLSLDDVRVGEVQSLSRSERPVLRVYGPRAQPLRAQLFLRFDGRIWHAVRDSAPVEPPPTQAGVGPRAAPMLARAAGEFRLLPGVAAEETTGDEVVASRLEAIDLDEGLLVLPGDALGVKTEDEVHVDSSGLLQRHDRRQPDPYVVVHRRRLGVADARPITDAQRALALALPRLLDPRTSELAASLSRASGAAPDAPMLSPRGRIDRTVAHLREAYRYTLETPPYIERDAIAEFLFVHRAGYCEHFASALAVLLRLEGVPARYVTGFRIDEGDKEGEHYLVRDEHAHAWVEAWMDGTGWIEVDATPTIERPLRARRSGLRALLGQLHAFFVDLRATIRYGGAWETLRKLRWPGAIVLSLIGLAYVVRNEIRRRLAEGGGKKGPRRAREPLPPELERCLRDVDSAWRKVGHPRPKSSGLLEHAAIVEAAGIEAELAAAIRAAIEPIHRSAFAGEAPAPETLSAARRRLRRAR